MSAFYNDNDPFAAAWLGEMIKVGLLPEGEVDDRSVLDVEPDELGSFRQCHFFAGIGGWPHALDLAGWPQDREVWTGSLPCQPLSVAGQQRGHADERHLWPAFYRLVAERRPATILGEQVAGKLGAEWFAGVRADLEELGYACGASSLPACSVGAPHRRERLWWCALADAGHAERRPFAEGRHVDDRHDQGRDQAPGRSATCGSMGDADGAGQFEQRWSIAVGPQQRSPERRGGSPWDNAEWRVGADGKARRVKPGVRLLAHGFPNRVGLLRGFGNAIVPQVAAAFAQAVMEAWQ